MKSITDTALAEARMGVGNCLHPTQHLLQLPS